MVDATGQHVAELRGHSGVIRVIRQAIVHGHGAPLSESHGGIDQQQFDRQTAIKNRTQEPLVLHGDRCDWDDGDNAWAGQQRGWIGRHHDLRCADGPPVRGERSSQTGPFAVDIAREDGVWIGFPGDTPGGTTYKVINLVDSSVRADPTPQTVFCDYRFSDGVTSFA